MKKIIFLITILLLSACSAISEKTSLHYHTNWALFVNGERINFSGNQYMEPVLSCNLDESQLNPQQRVHLHNNDQDVVHVHAAGATWNHFLNNIGWDVGKDYLVTDKNENLKTNDGHHLTFILNGEQIQNIQNIRIEDNDRLLISYGSEPFNEILTFQFSQVKETAHEHNEKDDPETCSAE